MLSPKRASLSVRAACQPAAARCQSSTCAARRVGDVADDGLARDAEARLDVAELAVAVGGLVEVHEVEVDLGPRQLDVRLRVQVQQRLLQRVEPRSTSSPG
jgi:hypothetical protein